MMKKGIKSKSSSFEEEMAPVADKWPHNKEGLQIITWGQGSHLIN